MHLVHTVMAQDYIPRRGYDRLVDDTQVEICALLDGSEASTAIPGGRRYHIAQGARQYMLDRQRDPPTIAEIANELRTNHRTLQYAFVESFGTSPKAFLKGRRLLSAHRKLRETTDQRCVCDVAFGLGFWDMGYFARDYKAMFGELPSETLAKDSTVLKNPCEHRPLNSV